MREHPNRAWRLLAMLGLLLPLPLAAQAAAAGTAGPALLARRGAVHGVVLGADTREPLGAASVRLLELGRGELTHEDGTFHFESLPAGRYTLAVQRLGFSPEQRVVDVAEDGRVEVEILLTPSAVSIPGLVVTGTGRERSATEAYRPTTVLDDAELRRQLSSSIAATLADQPGISQRYNGPAASQPVIRGLSGDRVLVLEDGNRTGDISSTSSDHAVTIEPLTAERIEVLRGPAGLMYGSNALGGVINVVREEVPRTLPERVTGTISAQAESVNQGFTAGGTAQTAIGSFALRGELSGRIADDTRTPLGDLPSSQMEGYNAGAGLSWIGSGGFAGAAVRDYSMDYGVPGSFNGLVIPGGHEGGVTIDLRRTAVRAEAGLLSGLGPFNAVEWDGQYTRFSQDEIERTGNVGTSFGQLTATTDLKAHHRHAIPNILLEGTVGLWALWQDHQVAGAAGSAPATQTSVAGYAFEELSLDPFKFQVGGRFDWTRVQPEEERAFLLGDLETRDFSAFSGSVAALWEPRTGVVVGSSISRAFRTPSITELFSNGPHLADYSFNIGNPDLEAEFGTGVDLFARMNRARVSGEVAVYRNWIGNYIYYAPTGQLDPRLQRFPVYQAAGDDAILQGAEGRVEWEVVDQLVIDVGGSYVRGSRENSDEPLPAIPPLHGSLDVRYDEPRFFINAGLSGAAAQERVGGFEQPTDGYTLLQAGGGLRWTAWGDLHTLTLQVSNLTDEVWYDHLSRIRTVAPQPGRNVELLYRVSF